MPSLQNSTYPIVNPYTPLAFIPPDLANQFVLVVYMLAATVGVRGVLSYDIGTVSEMRVLLTQIWFWDVVMSIPEEIRMCAGRKLTVTDLIYFSSR